MDDDDVDGVHLVYQYFRVKQQSPSSSSSTSSQPTSPSSSFRRQDQDKDYEVFNKRQEEYDYCLTRNLCHENVACVHILFESDSDLEATTSMLSQQHVVDKETLSTKLHPTILGRQMLYSDAMEYANEKLSGKVVVILNADIYLGQGVEMLCRSKHLLEPTTKNGHPASVMSLTRHEHGICKHIPQEMASTDHQPQQHQQYNNGGDDTWCGCPFMKGRKYYGSHDSFWFISPLDSTVIRNCQHVQNRWGSEHKVINELLNAGYQVINPSLTIHTYHHHATDIHPWRHQQGGRVALADPRDHIRLPPTELIDL